MRHDHTDWLIHCVRDRVPEQDFPGQSEEEARYFQGGRTSRLHTAGKLICAAVALQGRAWKVSAASHMPGQARVAFASDLGLDAVCAFQEALEASLQTLIEAGHPIRVQYVDSPDKVAALAPQEPVKDFPEWPVRMISPVPGFWRPCLGAHCSTTREVNAVILTKVRLKAGDLSISYNVG